MKVSESLVTYFKMFQVILSTYALNHHITVEKVIIDQTCSFTFKSNKGNN